MIPGFFRGEWLEFGDEQRYSVSIRICKLIVIGSPWIRRWILYWYRKGFQTHNLYLWPFHIVWRIGPYIPRPAKTLEPSPAASTPGSCDASTP